MHATDTDQQLDAAIGQAITWLRDATPQPDGARMSHHGIHLSTELRPPRFERVAIAPRAFTGKPVFIFDVGVRFDHEGDLIDPFTAEECNQLRAAVERVAPVAEVWNGPGCTSFSVALDESAAPPAVGLVDNYRAGCRTHPGRSVFCDCEQWRSGFDLARRPAGWR